MSTGFGREGIRQVCATLLGARHVPERLCGGSVYTWGAIQVFDLFTFNHEAYLYQASVQGSAENTRGNAGEPCTRQGVITSKIKRAIKLKTSPARFAQMLQKCCSPHWHFVLACSQLRRTFQDWTVRRRLLFISRRAEGKRLNWPEHQGGN